MKVTLSCSQISPQAKSYVMDVLASGWLSRRKYIPIFEKRIAKMHGGKQGVFVNSGTDALRIALLTLKEMNGWQNGDEVIIPGLTFVATANAVLQSGLKPVFADVQMQTGNIEPSQIAKRLTPLTRAVLAVHLFGQPANMPAVMQIARKKKLKVIEDSCEAVGVHDLTGDMACFSFYQSHHIQCGVGGMIVTNSPKYECVARSYMNHGRIDDGTHFRFGRIGYSSRATEMEAAIGVANADSFSHNLQRRRSLAFRYFDNLLLEKELNIPEPSRLHSWMFMPLTLRSGNRDKLLKYLRHHGIESREAMPLINQPCYEGLYERGSCPNAEFWTEKGLILPCHPLMDNEQVDHVCNTVKRFFKQ